MTTSKCAQNVGRKAIESTIRLQETCKGIRCAVACAASNGVGTAAILSQMDMDGCAIPLGAISGLTQL